MACNGNGLDKTFGKSKKAIGFVVGLVALIGIAFGAMLIGIETTWTGIVVVVCAAAAAYICSVHSLGQASVDKALAAAGSIVENVAGDGGEKIPDDDSELEEPVKE